MKGIIALIAVFAILSVYNRRKTGTAIMPAPNIEIMPATGNDKDPDPPQVSTKPANNNFIGIQADPMPETYNLNTVDDFKKMMIDIKKSINIDYPQNIPVMFFNDQVM
jgi:hypothetical protein